MRVRHGKRDQGQDKGGRLGLRRELYDWEMKGTTQGLSGGHGNRRPGLAGPVDTIDEAPWSGCVALPPPVLEPGPESRKHPKSVWDPQ